MEDTFVMFWKVNSETEAQFVLISILFDMGIRLVKNSYVLDLTIL